MRLPSLRICWTLRAGVHDRLAGVAAQALDAPEQVDRIGDETVLAAQRLGDHERLAGELDGRGSKRPKT